MSETSSLEQQKTDDNDREVVQSGTVRRACTGLAAATRIQSVVSVAAYSNSLTRCGACLYLICAMRIEHCIIALHSVANHLSRFQWSSVDELACTIAVDLLGQYHIVRELLYQTQTDPACVLSFLGRGHRSLVTGR